MKAINVIFLSITSCYFMLLNSSAGLYQSTVSRTSTDIQIGTLINDSTASTLVTNSTIQSSVIPDIVVLQNAQISGVPAVISAGNPSSYLIFEATAVTAKKILVAIELSKAGNSLTFKNETGKKIHIWETTGDCTSANIYHNRLENYIGCGCVHYAHFENRVGCYHLLFITP